MAEILDQIDPGIYRKYITIDGKVRKIMYAECLNAIYGTLNAALLFWLKLSTDLEIWGFKMNQYGWCVMNKDTKGE